MLQSLKMRNEKNRIRHGYLDRSSPGMHWGVHLELSPSSVFQETWWTHFHSHNIEELKRYGHKGESPVLGWRTVCERHRANGVIRHVAPSGCETREKWQNNIIAFG